MAKQVPSGNKGNSGTLTRPAKGETMNPNGRPKKIFTKICAELTKEGYERVTSLQVNEAYELLLGLDESKIKDFVSDTSQPMLLRIVGKTMLSPKGYEVLESMLDRAHGRAKQSIDLGGSVTLIKPQVNIMPLKEE